MAILKDALQGIWHHKVRSLLVLALCFTVAAEGFQFFCVNESTRASIDAIHKRAATEICIRYSYSKKTVKDSAGNIVYTPIDAATLQKLAALPHVAGHDYLTYRGTQVQKMIDFYSASKDTNSKYYTQEFQSMQGYYNNQTPDNPYLYPSAVVDCASDTSALGEFVYGGTKLVQGRAITQADKGKRVIMVPEYLAKEMNWKIGDQLSLTGSYKKQGSISATIVGIYKENPYQCFVVENGTNEGSVIPLPDASNPCFMNYTYFPYIFYAPFGMIDDAFWKDQWKQGSAEVAYYYLDDPKNAPDFISKAGKLLDTQIYSISQVSGEAPARMTGGVQSVLGQIGNSAKALLLIGSAAILLVCLFSALRRRGEFELLLKKKTGRAAVACRVILETLILVLVPFIVAAFIHGSNLYETGQKNVSDLNNKNKIDETKPSIMLRDYVIYGQFMPDYIFMPSGELKNAVTPAAVGEYALLGLGIFAGASVLSAAYVFTFRVRGKKDEPASAEEQPQRVEQNIKN